MTSLPSYVLRPGDIVGAPPVRAENCLMQLMILRGSRHEQQAYVDLVLNGPAQGAYRFEVLSDRVLLNVLHIGCIRSLDPVDSQKGVLSDGDISFWTLVRGWPADRPHLARLYWVASFLYVKTPASMASGREIYGYPKTASHIMRVSTDNWDPAVEVRALHMPQYDPAKFPDWQTVLNISSPTRAPRSTTVEAKVEEMWAQLGADPPLAQGRALPPSPSVMPQVMLRQFRDPFSLGSASLQQGLLNEPRPLAIRGTGLLGNDATVTITPSCSHPVCRTLGVPQVSTVDGIWIEQDFQFGVAQRLWG